MAVSENTLEAIYLIKDLDYEFNIKLFLFLGSLIMAFVSLYFSKKIDRTDPITDLIYYGMAGFGWIYIIFTPLISLLLLRSVSLNTVVIPIMIGFYSLFSTICILGLFFWLGKKFLEKYFNVKFGEDKRENRQERDYRRLE